jgi:hypothetical protein
LKQNISSNNNVILLLDSSVDFKDVCQIIKEKNPDIVTFDYESHILFKEKNIPHKISDTYISQNDLQSIQEKSYLFAHWFNESKISNLLQYDEINIGETFFIDFHYQLIPYLKKFFEIMKLFESNKNSMFITSSVLYNIISSFTSTVIKLKSDNLNLQNYDNAIKIPIKIGKFSYSIKLKYSYLQKLTKIFEKLFQFLLFTKDSKLKNGNTILFIDFTTKKYSHLFSILDKFSINLVKFDRIIPAVWNFESYSIIKKSNCLVENHSTLIDKHIKKSIEHGKNLIKNNTNLLWQQNEFFESFFSLNGKSFWAIIKPTLVKLYEQKANDAVQEIELTKKLFKIYKFDSILIWTESHINHLIAIKLAKKRNISVYFLQHGLYIDSPELVSWNTFVKVIPQYADKFLVWGDMLKQYALNNDFPENKLEIIGSTLHDGIFLTKNKNMIPKNKFILLAATSPIHNSLHDMTVGIMEKYLESIKNVCEISLKLGKNLVIKLHPHPDDFDVTDFVKKIDSRIIVMKSGDITPLIKSCDIFIVTDISTTILEAQIFEKPVIVFKIRDNLGAYEFSKSNSCISATMDDFESLFTRVLTDEKFKQEVIERGTKFYKNYLSNIGSASENLLSFLENVDINPKNF